MTMMKAMQDDMCRKPAACLQHTNTSTTSTHNSIVQSMLHTQWRGGAMGRSLDLRSTGHGFTSYSGQKLRNNVGHVVHTHVPLSSSSITW